MNIAFVEIKNFRKLKACRIEIAARETILVGANNSGKTSAMDAMILFLKKDNRKKITTTDFTLSNWIRFNRIGRLWGEADDARLPDLTISRWQQYLPSVDIWIDANDADLHHVVHLLPTLDWKPDEKLGVRLVFAPKDIEKFYKEFRDAYQSARNAGSSNVAGDKRKLALWPETMRDFLDRELHRYFEVKAYILDPAKCEEPDNGSAKPQLLPAGSEPINKKENDNKDPFDGLIKIDVISAQRGFSDPKTEDDSQGGFASLSTQLRMYFKKHLNPSESPNETDMGALQAIEDAKTAFDRTLKTSFQPALDELEGLNYPGFDNPAISLTSDIQPIDSLDHGTAVQFNLPGAKSLSLPERYNGLGYQNLISMVFSLIRFRDEWVHEGKAEKKQDDDGSIIEPLHIVLIEEPEAHLHAQVQQVFIKKAYEVLRNHKKLKRGGLNTQMVVSTHSSHIAHELDFSCLRYFRRSPVTKKWGIPFSTVVNLSKTFGSQDNTSKFAARYIKSTHCDLFFADAAILIEGSAERMLLPHFIENEFVQLDKSYISLLEIGGSHAHRLKTLIETLGLLTLVITDLDSIGETSAGKMRPERGKKFRTGNTTLKEWMPGKNKQGQSMSLDELLDCPDAEKQYSSKQIRVAYQCPIRLKYTDGEAEEEAIPYTFEDSLALTNVELFRKSENPCGLLEKLKSALEKGTLAEANKEMFESVTDKNSNKAGMALDLLYLTELRNLKAPAYIFDGLKWLEGKLNERQQEFLAATTTGVENG